MAKQLTTQTRFISVSERGTALDRLPDLPRRFKRCLTAFLLAGVTLGATAQVKVGEGFSACVIATHASQVSAMQRFQLRPGGYIRAEHADTNQQLKFEMVKVLTLTHNGQLIDVFHLKDNMSGQCLQLGDTAATLGVCSNTNPRMNWILPGGAQHAVNDAFSHGAHGSHLPYRVSNGGLNDSARLRTQLAYQNSALWNTQTLGIRSDATGPFLGPRASTTSIPSPVVQCNGPIRHTQRQAYYTTHPNYFNETMASNNETNREHLERFFHSTDYLYQTTGYRRWTAEDVKWAIDKHPVYRDRALRLALYTQVLPTVLTEGNSSRFQKALDFENFTNLIQHITEDPGVELLARAALDQAAHGKLPGIMSRVQTPNLTEEQTRRLLASSGVYPPGGEGYLQGSSAIGSAIQARVELETPLIRNLLQTNQSTSTVAAAVLALINQDPDFARKFQVRTVYPIVAGKIQAQLGFPLLKVVGYSAFPGGKSSYKVQAVIEADSSFFNKFLELKWPAYDYATQALQTLFGSRKFGMEFVFGYECPSAVSALYAFKSSECWRSTMGINLVFGRTKFEYPPAPTPSVARQIGRAVNETVHAFRDIAPTRYPHHGEGSEGNNPDIVISDGTGMGSDLINRADDSGVQAGQIPVATLLEMASLESVSSAIFATALSSSSWAIDVNTPPPTPAPPPSRTPSPPPPRDADVPPDTPKYDWKAWKKYLGAISSFDEVAIGLHCVSPDVLNGVPLESRTDRAKQAKLLLNDNCYFDYSHTAFLQGQTGVLPLSYFLATLQPNFAKHINLSLLNIRGQIGIGAGVSIPTSRRVAAYLSDSTAAGYGNLVFGGGN